MSSMQIESLAKNIPVTRMVSPTRHAQKDAQESPMVKVFSAEEIMDSLSPQHMLIAADNQIN